MSYPPLIKEILVGSTSLRLIIKEETPFVECQGHLFNHIWLLNQQMPDLFQMNYIKEFAEVSNFLWKGLQFQFIEQIEEYQEFYIERVELERKCPSDVFPFRLTDYKIFDVSVMHEPHVEDGQLFYFVYHTSTGLPYRVVCPFPYLSTSTVVHYQILPIKTGSIAP